MYIASIFTFLAFHSVNHRPLSQTFCSVGSARYIYMYICYFLRNLICLIVALVCMCVERSEAWWKAGVTSPALPSCGHIVTKTKIFLILCKIIFNVILSTQLLWRVSSDTNFVKIDQILTMQSEILKMSNFESYQSMHDVTAMHGQQVASTGNAFIALSNFETTVC